MADRVGFESQHFSLNNPRGEEQGDVPMLLRRLASTLEEMGGIEIRDLILHSDTDDAGDPWPYVTVYYSPLPDDGAELP
ncbi:hypothetical protein [Nonomuraea sp. C10]|uniref:hypothetical protein n=1 Tax=Nonomuraea sp. C10 TaxID=2600577 RepID=UPI0011CD7D42|nr:hypothetical protein [Nonomuraea sp. C10]TXK35761.1 hypothetical protein FR742_42040 [Nonomuraea sp. C10]